MTGSIFTQPYGRGWVANGRITEYTATISRDEYPTWTATVTGGDLPAAGHVFSALSYARMYGVKDPLLNASHRECSSRPVIPGFF